jgi:hypothetical protein
MNQEDNESEPLLPQSTENSRTAEVERKSKKYLVVALIGFLVLVAYVVVYFVYLPPKIQEAVDGNGSNIQHIHLLDVDPVRVNISVKIPVDPLPLSINVQVGKMMVTHLRVGAFAKRPIGMFLFPSIVGSAGDDHLWVNDTLEIEELDYAFISWHLKQAINHGFKRTDISL